MMSVNEGSVAFGFALATFHGYSFIVVYSLMANFLQGKGEKDKDEDEEMAKNDDEETALGENETWRS